uniref:palmitoyl-protein hydrolase n=1 Tax=Ditylenchus dipsaci TaxID=166011 RepID=A0A915CN75_9BILA
MDFLKFAQTIFSKPQVSVGPVSDKPPVVKLAKEKHTATMIFLHGLGDNGDGWADVLSNEMHLPYFKYIVPHAASRPVALNLGYSSPAWFDILGLSDDTNEDDAGIEAAALYVHNLIDEEVATGTPSNRIVLGGFSMGGALAIYAGLTCKQGLGCIISFSGFMLQKHKIPGEHTANLQTPIFLGHGTKDPMVPATYGIEVEQVVKVFNPNVEFKQYDMGHTCSLEEKVEASSFISKNVPANFASEKEENPE